MNRFHKTLSVSCTLQRQLLSLSIKFAANYMLRFAEEGTRLQLFYLLTSQKC